MRVLHTSDWHLGRSLHGHNLLEDQRFALDQLLNLVQERRVDVLLLAGDVYDRALPPDGAVALFNGFLERLIVELGVVAVAIPGNHDSALRLGFGATLLKPQGLHLLTDLSAAAEPVRLSVRGQRLHIYGLPYASPELVRTTFDAAEVRSAEEAMAFLIERIRGTLESGVTNVLLSHCFVAGGYSSDSERPLSVGGADQVSARHFDDFDYVALGHLHRPHTQGREQMRYSGSLLKYSVSEEDHDKGVVLFEVREGAIRNVETVSLQARRDVRTVQGTLEEVLHKGSQDARADDYVQVVLDDTQALHDVHGRLAKVYPNRLQVLRPAVRSRTADSAQNLAAIQLGELAMFEDFFEYSAGRALLPQEQALLQRALTELRDNPADPQTGT